MSKTGRITIKKNTGMWHLYRVGQKGEIVRFIGKDERHRSIYEVHFDKGFNSIVYGHHMKSEEQ